MQENINDLIKKISLTYCDTSDISTWYDMKYILSNRQTINRLLKACSEKYLNSKKIDDDLLFLFFLAEKVSKMQEILHLIGEDDKKHFKQIIRNATKYLHIVPNSEVIKYFDNNSERLLTSNKVFTNRSSKAVLSYAIHFQSGLSERTWIFLSKKYGYILLDKPSELHKILSSKYGHIILDNIITIESKHDLVGCHLEQVLNLFLYIHQKIKKKNIKEKLLAIVSKKTTAIYDILNELGSVEAVNDFTLSSINEMRAFLKYLQKTKDKRYVSFSKTYKKTQLLIDSYIKDNGKQFKYEVPIRDAMESWRSSPNWEIKLISLTHSLDKKHNKLVSLLDGDHEQASIIDSFSTNIPTDNFFTYGHQERINILANLLSSIIECIICNPEDRAELFKLLASSAHHINDRVRSDRSNSLEYDIAMVIDGLEKIATQYLQNNNIAPIDYYGTSMAICSTSEKLLRVLLEDITRDQIFIPIESLELGKLLNNSKEISNIFGVNHIKNLAYFLSTYGEEKIGKDLRNKLAHLSDDIEKNLGLNLITMSLWLMIDIMNTLFIYYLAN